MANTNNGISGSGNGSPGSLQGPEDSSGNTDPDYHPGTGNDKSNNGNGNGNAKKTSALLSNQVGSLSMDFISLAAAKTNNGVSGNDKGKGNSADTKVQATEEATAEDPATVTDSVYAPDALAAMVTTELEPTEDITTDLVKENPFRYAGYYFDRKTQYYYLQARYYDPRPARFISEDTYEGEIDSPLTLNLYTYVENNPLKYMDPSGHSPVIIGHIYVIQGPVNGKIETYVGSTAQDILKRMGKHKWKTLVRDPSTTVITYEVKAELNVKGSNKGTIRSAVNEALRSAEQRVINIFKNNGKLLNEVSAATETKMEVWEERHSVKIDMKSPKLSLKGGVRVGVNSSFALWDAFTMYRQLKVSKYEFAPYILQDEGGVFTIGEGQANWFATHYYWKTYKSGPMAGKKVYIDKDDFNFWKREAQALWGRLDFWGDFEPGLLNPRLPVANVI